MRDIFVGSVVPRFLVPLVFAVGLLTACTSSMSRFGAPEVRPLPIRKDEATRLEIRCGRREACEGEASRRCPSGYRVESSDEWAGHGVESAAPGLGTQTQPSRIEGADSSTPGRITPGAPVPHTRMVIVC